MANTDNGFNALQQSMRLSDEQLAELAEVMSGILAKSIVEAGNKEVIIDEILQVSGYSDRQRVFLGYLMAELCAKMCGGER